MVKKIVRNCAVCKKPIEKGTGILCRGKIVHEKCKGLLKIHWWKFQK